MRTLRMLLVISAFAAVSCTASSVTVTSPAPTDGKPTAPVDLKAELFASQAKVTMHLEEDGTDLAVSAWGLDGLEVGSPAAFTPKISRRGENETFVIPMTPGEGRSNLAVSISGTFHGAKLQRVATFSIGTGPVKQTVETIVTDQGETLKGSRAPTPKQPNTPTTPATP